MDDQFSRTEMLLGSEAIKRLSDSCVAVFGIGGVGGYTVEALARSGIGSFVLIDNDKISPSNINRQIIATRKTISLYKVDVMKERILDINPDAKVDVYKCFFLPENSNEFDFSRYSYVVDAVDTVTAKLEIIEKAKKSNVPIISSMGAGNKLDPTRFEVTDIYKTSVCPLAKVIRQECRKRGIDNLKVVYSTEKSITPHQNSICSADSSEKKTNRKSIPGSVSFVPSVAGLIIAGEVIKDLSRVEIDE